MTEYGHDIAPVGALDEAALLSTIGPAVTPALHALQGYGAVVHEGSHRAVNHPMRVAAGLHDFANGLIDPRVYSVAVLHDLAQRVHDRDYGRNALRALNAYATDDGVSKNEWEYVSAHLGDLDVVEEYSESIRHAEHGGNVQLKEILRSKSSSEVSIPIWMWNADSDLTSPAQMLELLDRVNLASVLTKGAEMLDNLMYPSRKDGAILQDIFDAESFYAPLSEITGFDGLAMALRGKAARIRLERSGNIGVLHEAQTQLDALGSREFVARAIGGMFTELVGGDSIVEHAVENKAQHQVTIGESLLQHPSLGATETMRAVWRLKTLGSLAMKLARGKSAYDLVGITLMAEDTDQLASVYRMLADKVAAGMENGTVNASGEIKPFDVRGDSTFLEKVLGTAGSECALPGAVAVMEKPTGDYEVAKMTFLYKVIDGGVTRHFPVEIQLQTEEARTRSRIGTASHIAYKAARGGPEGERPAFEVELLAKIRERKSQLRAPQLAEESVVRGAALRRLVSKSKSH